MKYWIVQTVALEHRKYLVSAESRKEAESKFCKSPVHLFEGNQISEFIHSTTEITKKTYGDIREERV